MGSGLIGWVANHGRSIHVSPFDRDSTTLGVYSSDQHLKSFIGVPIELPGSESSSGDDAISSGLRGVLTCDSKKSFAFSKLQGKLLEELASQISSTVQLIRRSPNKTEERSWQSFMAHALRLVEALGIPSVDVMRVRVSNLDQLEAGAGSPVTIELMEQVQRLIQQALPPHFPVCKMPQGDIVLLIDNMMTGFYENKIRAICDRITQPHGIMQIDFAKRTLREMASQAKVGEQGTGRSTIERAVGNAALSFVAQEVPQLAPSLRSSREYRTA